jgi:orotate phosphoribosyltransferase
VDREQGGPAALAARGLTLHAVFTLREVMEALRRRGAVDDARCGEVMDYLTRSAA